MEEKESLLTNDEISEIKGLVGGRPRFRPGKLKAYKNAVNEAREDGDNRPVAEIISDYKSAIFGLKQTPQSAGAPIQSTEQEVQPSMETTEVGFITESESSGDVISEDTSKLLPVEESTPEA